MEFAVAKRRGKRRRKRRLKKQLRERSKCEVRSARYSMVFPEYVTDTHGTLSTGMMQADAFWKNYMVAQEWQKRHNITWWRSRCIALEHENKLLRDKVRLLARYRGYRDTGDDGHHMEDNDDDGSHEENYAEFGTNNEDLEFNVTEDLLNFFETSERHKQEMRQKYKTAHEENSGEMPFVGAAEKARMKKEEADLLYGDAGSKILAMETALQSTVERFEDTANPQYWPNIPLKP